MHKSKMLPIALPILFLISSLGGCARKQEASPAPPPVPVTVANVRQMDVPVIIKAVGQVDAFSTIEVKSLVTGTITEIYFKEGQLVKKDDKLLLIDPRPFEAALNQAQANLARDTYQAANFRRVANRTRELFDRGAATRDELDTITATADAQEAGVKADEAATIVAKLQLGYCNIRSPIEGIAGILSVDEGNLVKANDVSLVSLKQIEPIYVTFSVPQQDLPRIRGFMSQGPLTVNAYSPADPTLHESGTLTLIDNAIDPTTGTVKMRATFENKDRGLWPGQFVGVDLVATIDKDMLVVPASALQASQEGPYIWTIKNNVAQMQAVRVGRLVGDDLIILEGLSKDQKVVTDGQLRLIPGSVAAEKPPVTGPVKAAASSPATLPAGPAATSTAAATASAEGG